MNLPTRRSLLKAGLVGSAAAWLLAGCGDGNTRDAYSTVGTLDFANPLRIPPLAPATRSSDGARVFELAAAEGSTQFLPDRPTPTWGYNGSYLGPTLRATRGEKVRIAVVNRLPEATSVHWHGMHLPAGMDGGPHQMVAPGGTWTPEWVVNQPAATLWYHPHPHGATEQQVNRGLAGLFLVEDPEAAPDGLPRDYGRDDFPVVVQDRNFAKDGSFHDGPRALTGLTGNSILVNGTWNPHLAVSTEAVRLRLLNASSARSYSFGFDDGRGFAVVASDGGLLAAPAAVDRVLLSPGERAEVVVRFAPGERVELRSFPHELGMTTALANGAGGNDTLSILQFRAAARLSPSPELPAALPGPGAPDLSAIAATRTFILNGRHINGRQLDHNRIDTVVGAGTTEIWNVSNTHNQPHNFHIHDVRFRILDIDGAPPPPELAGLKDTVFLPVRASARLAVPFGNYTDAAMPYMYHCHLLWHEDEGMMGQFTVVEPGQTGSAPPAAVQHQH
ncbi:multicopper oxidase domain-containing protein [Arthrobacter sp. I2-34]|uniref:Multicopper oxidase CueO n=1 Tax=Arthrobacter hankyongi TaxID=2904801 RepID=A0ABS9L697_9MICC|nr:multicopper oxidase domain-containing protein [Arthrobacter hankyongi]MCG2622201.1 multicopper oxidase domain-containing protein [Arthrobacter hankyongi]